jgi:hypothetical protein
MSDPQDLDFELNRREAILCLLGIVGAGGTVWVRDSLAGPVTLDQFRDQVQTLPRGELPDFARSVGPNVREAYRYAAEHGKDLEFIPCFCGCKNIGHRHNRDCYIKSENADGTVTYTSHSAT